MQALCNFICKSNTTPDKLITINCKPSQMQPLRFVLGGQYHKIWIASNIWWCTKKLSIKQKGLASKQKGCWPKFQEDASGGTYPRRWCCGQIPMATPSKNQCHKDQPKSVKSNAIKNDKNQLVYSRSITKKSRGPNHRFVPPSSSCPYVPCVQQVCRGGPWSAPHLRPALARSAHQLWWRCKPIFQWQSCLCNSLDERKIVWQSCLFQSFNGNYWLQMGNPCHHLCSLDLHLLQLSF